MKVPADNAMAITFINLLVSEIFSPILIPTGVEREKHIIKIVICNKLKPVFANAAPRDRAAHVLWITIPIASCKATYVVGSKPKAIPSKNS